MLRIGIAAAVGKVRDTPVIFKNVRSSMLVSRPDTYFDDDPRWVTRVTEKSGVQTLDPEIKSLVLYRLSLIDVVESITILVMDVILFTCYRFRIMKFISKAPHLALKTRC
ncbi:hypothetical protein TNIN_162961 [Trichonephila inaurata madagascariensis]|uniref:Uncharacterized protein n=1 Tax=Trichonephila inaurata madagascariensis TaxID=2747483 RepID=A0A8X6YDP7_9ARAC|nr:hypothetical protein TNIN_162961 [Trichonephila inaurata madagascariensis]